MNRKACRQRCVSKEIQCEYESISEFFHKQKKIADCFVKNGRFEHFKEHLPPKCNIYI